MGNDDKINAAEIEERREAETHKEVQLFLKDELKNLSFSKAAQYNLEQEYAKTRKNKNKSVIIILAICVIAVAVIVAGLTFFIISQNKKIKVNIDTFNDLNLRALLNSAGRAESLYANAVQAKEELISQRDDELNAAAQKREDDLYVLQSVSKVSTKDSIEKRSAEIQEEYKRTIDAVNKKYDLKIADADKEIASYQERLSGYDATDLSAAKADEAALDSQKQLNDLQMRSMEMRYQSQIKDLKKQMSQQRQESVRQQREAVENVRKTYQAKIDLLDPDARSQSDVQDQIILETGIPKSAVSTSAIQFNDRFDSTKYTSSFASPSEAFSSSVKDASVYLDDLNTIANRFSTIPLENTIRHYVPAMQRLAYHITTEMAEAEQAMQTEIDSLKDTVSQKDSQIAVLESGFDAICASDKENIADACIIDTSNRNAAKLYVTKIGEAKFSQGQSLLDAQIREGKRIYCELTVTKDGESFTASPKPGSKSQNIAYITPGAKVYFVLPAAENAKK